MDARPASKAIAALEVSNDPASVKVARRFAVLAIALRLEVIAGEHPPRARAGGAA